MFNFMRFKLKNKETTSFKKRHKTKNSDVVLRFGACAFLLQKTTNVEFNYISYFRRILKIFFKFRKTKFKKIWIFLNKNFPITKKSKNARMGKGKGKLLRYCMKITSNYTLFEFDGFSKNYLCRIRKLFNFRLHTRILIFSDFLFRSNYKFFDKSVRNFYIQYKNI